MTDFSQSGKPISCAGGYDEVRISSGEYSFWLNGRRHRTDGPARVTSAGVNEWHVDGQLVEMPPREHPVSARQ